MVEWFISSCDSKMGLGTWAIVHTEEETVIGIFLFVGRLKKWSSVLLLQKNIGVKALPRKVLSALLAYGHNKLGLNEIICTVHHENIASKKVLEKLGYKYDRNIIHFGISQELFVKSS